MSQFDGGFWKTFTNRNLALNVKWTDIDFDSEQIHVRVEIAKYNKDCYIDLAIQA
jgi:hypothetical protein